LLRGYAPTSGRPTDRGYRKPVMRSPYAARNSSDVTSREHRASAFCAQVRCDGRGWVTVGISPTRGEAARTAAQAYVTPICNMTPRQVRVMRLA
jgi:hypothetical protein